MANITRYNITTYNIISLRRTSITQKTSMKTEFLATLLPIVLGKRVKDIKPKKILNNHLECFLIFE